MNLFLAAARPTMRRRRQRAFALAVLLAFFGNASWAETPSFEDLEARLRDHPSLAALHAEAEAREELAVAEGALPDPVFSFGVGSIPVRNPGFDREPDANKAFGVAQDIPNFGVRRARSARERAEASAMKTQADYRFALLRADLVAALAEKRRIKEQMVYAEQQLRKYGQIQEILGGELEAGRPIYYRLSEIDVERVSAEQEVVALTTALAQVDAPLVNLVGEAPDIPPPPIVVAPWDGGALSLWAARLADAGINIAKAGVREGKAAFGPNFGVNVTYMQRENGIDAAGAPLEGDDWFAAGVSLSVPLWALKNQAPRLRAARARQSSAELSYQAAYRETQQKLNALMAEHAAAERNIALFDRKAKAIDQTIAALRRNYEAGNGDYAQVLDAEIAKLTLLSLLAAERANAIAHAAHINSELVTP